MTATTDTSLQNITTFVPYCTIDSIIPPFSHSSLLIDCAALREVEFQLNAAANLIGLAPHTTSATVVHAQLPFAAHLLPGH